VKSFVKWMLLEAMLFLVGGSILGAQISIGIRIGRPPPPRVVHVLPPRPGPEYLWVDGYWYPAGKHYKWHEGYWTRPPYEGSRWVAPRYYEDQYYNGYWDGERGQLEHDHHWDRDHDRDFRDHHHDKDHH
jgi:hypothetical protein